ncbi:HlyD family secretion protein [Emticicia sp. 21SJ11W-3]|uniref:HlyD family secretion protein n=1 Tax=Emticicia sp. 21SJ11W-3 TaxID=2916755 RepID=UPI0020A1DA9E|nr:HlyD family efflux transporter periplasmic adaptor subunit [Emticicia sp. 21SJ11W-3]UTA67896.1 HlyD family secretion protein [Emticicia sp. 21SJ11W-3]
MGNNKDTAGELSESSLTELVGGKDVISPDLLNSGSDGPPVPPVLNKGGGGGGDNHSNLPELRNSQVDEVLNQPPAWLVRWGVSVFFFVLMILLGVAWFVEYPDLVGAPMMVVSDNSPKSVNVRTDGRLTRLLVKEGETVKQGAHLAYLESTASVDEVFSLEATVNQLIQLSLENDFAGIHRVRVPLYFSLGELQKSFQTFQEALVRSQSSMPDGSYLKKKSAVNRDINTLESIQQNTRAQLELQEKDLQMALEEAQSQQRLSDKGFVSKQEARNAQSRYLSKKQAFEQAKGSLDNNSMSRNQKQQELIELDKTIEEQKNNLVQSINSLKSDIEAWKQRYVAIAPISGKVNFLTSLQENQILKAGQELLYILPDGTGYHGEMMLGQYNFGKVKTNQEVIVKFQSYPFQEFGTVTGRVAYISDIPKDTVYVVRVNFPGGLVTTADKKLPFRNGMTATGEIITENLKLIEKLFYDIRKTMKR